MEHDIVEQEAAADAIVDHLLQRSLSLTTPSINNYDRTAGTEASSIAVSHTEAFSIAVSHNISGHSF